MEVESAFWRVPLMDLLHLLPVPRLLPASICVLMPQSSAVLNRGWFIIIHPDGKTPISDRVSARRREGVVGEMHLYAVGPKCAKTKDSAMESTLLWRFLS